MLNKKVAQYFLLDEKYLKKNIKILFVWYKKMTNIVCMIQKDDKYCLSDKTSLTVSH